MVLKIILNVLNVLTHQINTNKSSVDLDMRLLAFGSVSKSTCDENFLMEKYFTKWYSKVKYMRLFFQIKLKFLYSILDKKSQN